MKLLLLDQPDSVSDYILAQLARITDWDRSCIGLHNGAKIFYKVKMEFLFWDILAIRMFGIGQCPISRIGEVLKISVFWFSLFDFFQDFFLLQFAWKLVRCYWLARMGQNFDQAKCDITFWPLANILMARVLYVAW